MNVAVARTQPQASPSIRAARALTVLIVILAAIASVGGLFIRGLYRDPVDFVQVLRGQDLVTLLAMPVLIMALLLAGRGSARAMMVWIGLLGYVLYTYTGASFGYFFNDFFAIYVALFSLCVFALAAIVSSIDVSALQQRFDSATPRKPVAVFLVLIALMLGPMEMGQIASFVTTGVLPEIIRRSGGVTNFVYVLDLGMVVPLSLLSAVWLWRRVAWGYVLAGCILIKGTTMGLALLSMNWFSVLAGQPTDGLETMWAIIAFGCLGMSVWFFRHCRG